MLRSTLRLAAAIALSTAPALAEDAPKPEAATTPPTIAAPVAPAASPAAPGTVVPAPATPASPAEIIIPPAPAAAPTIGIDPSRFGEKPADPAFGAYQRGLYLTAYNLALPRAEAGDPAAQTLFAEIYARGLGLAKIRKPPPPGTQRAAEPGCARSAIPVGAAPTRRRLVAKDDKARAMELMQTAADAGNRLAQFNLAQLIIDSELDPVRPGFARAVPYYQRAADTGLADAQYAIAQIHATGADGINKDEP